MSFRKSIFMILLAFGLLSACGEKKAKEMEAEAAQVEKAAAEMKEKAAEKAAKLKAAKERVADSLKRVDSLQQVKEHGHAH